MPLRPLPLPYKVGIDICFIPRIRSLLLAGGRSFKAFQPISHQRDVITLTRDIPRRSAEFVGIPSLDRRSNETLRYMSVHLNPNFLAKLLRPEEITMIHGLYQKVAETMGHERLFEYVAGRYVVEAQSDLEI
jgi:hypothetical protein